MSNKFNSTHKNQKKLKKQKPKKWVDFLFWGVFIYIWAAVFGFGGSIFSFGLMFPVIVVAIIVIGRCGGSKYRQNFSSRNSLDYITDPTYSYHAGNIYNRR